MKALPRTVRYVVPAVRRPSTPGENPPDSEGGEVGRDVLAGVSSSAGFTPMG